jgi:hypothetical protein
VLGRQHATADAIADGTATNALYQPLSRNTRKTMNTITGPRRREIQKFNCLRSEQYEYLYYFTTTKQTVYLSSNLIKLLISYFTSITLF